MLDHCAPVTCVNGTCNNDAGPEAAAETPPGGNAVGPKLLKGGTAAGIGELLEAGNVPTGAALAGLPPK